MFLEFSFEYDLIGIIIPVKAINKKQMNDFIVLVFWLYRVCFKDFIKMPGGGA